ncbi:flagellar hook-associated protein FlgK [uncultured Cohaesibacter sp.]|uniref:flagellar hook-associated protein FlgK n=1 Tax=uncultured Cohaesibacter sp. TaxID=1002546 RepID=UPI0029C68A85|nr:flagellar hook-associated protein FlgK [uncultured Cohaesibacter sp.]
MSLSVALQVAQSALSTRQKETAVLSRNITNATQEGYTRKTALVSTLHSSDGSGGGVYISSISRATDQALFSSLVSSTSVGERSEAYLDGLTQLSATIGDTDQDISPAAVLGELESALQAYGAMPSDSVLAGQVLTAAQNMASTLNDASSAVQAEREAADAEIAQSVETINEQLAIIEELNDEIVRGTELGSDVTDAMDARDQAVLALSAEIGIKTQTRENNDLIITTESGVMMFETTARSVTFEQTDTYSASTIGNSVRVDGVPVAGPDSRMEISNGRIAGLVAVRDEAAVTYQNQLDEMARGLITAFQESGNAGIFSYSGGPAIPASGTLVSGLAADIEVNSAIDTDHLDLIRDGITVDYNPDDYASYGDRIQDLLGNLDQSMTFDLETGVDTTATLSDFAASSVSWLEAARQNANNTAENQSITLNRVTESFSNATGVNIDEEMQSMLEIERSYTATAKLISTIDEMLDQLLEIAG